VNVKLTPEQEQIIKDELKAGRFRTAEEVIARALQQLKQRESLMAGVDLSKAQVVQQNAVREMIDFVEKNHVRLSGISVKDLIHEGTACEPVRAGCLAGAPMVLRRRN
jgi:putative addiction module CopG family antidote